MLRQSSLTRAKFREGVFSRDGGKCVFCEADAVDAHHLIERRLWKDGGYLLDNGISVCARHHLLCEQTKISVEEGRRAAKIDRIVLPEHLYEDEVYDKWGNIILPNGRRLRGELFEDPSVQSVLRDVLHFFTYYVKYPRTYHLPWSKGMHGDDRMMERPLWFHGQDVIVTTKMDGEQTTMYRDHIHARSLESASHESQSWVKQFWGRIRHDIPIGWRVCGENLYATHSIYYTELSSYFLGFSIWNEKNICLSWDDTLEWFELLGITPVPTLYRGTYDESAIRVLWQSHNWHTMEGYVVRIAERFHYSEFRNMVGKFVRPRHIQTTQHWRYGQQMHRNTLRDK